MVRVNQSCSPSLPFQGGMAIKHQPHGKWMTLPSIVLPEPTTRPQVLISQRPVGGSPQQRASGGIVTHGAPESHISARCLQRQMRQNS